MEVGDKVYLYSGEGREIKELKFEYLDSPIKVYNFEVEDWHTYFVSEQDVFVHNSCGGKGTNKTVGNGEQYSTLYESNTGSGASRSAHRNAANKEFYNQMANDNQFKSVIDDYFEYDVMDYMKSGKGSLKNPSKDWIWHHPADTQGKIRLIPKNQHQSPILQDILHPGPNGQGGFGLFK